MIELVFIACSIVNGAKCVEHKQTYLAHEIPVYACAKYGQQELAKWTAAHPNWRVSRWKCRPAGMMAKA